MFCNNKMIDLSVSAHYLNCFDRNSNIYISPFVMSLSPSSTHVGRTFCIKSSPEAFPPICSRPPAGQGLLEHHVSQGDCQHLGLKEANPTGWELKLPRSGALPENLCYFIHPPLVPPVLRYHTNWQCVDIVGWKQSHWHNLLRKQTKVHLTMSGLSTK